VFWTDGQGPHSTAYHSTGPVVTRDLRRSGKKEEKDEETQCNLSSTNTDALNVCECYVRQRIENPIRFENVFDILFKLFCSDPSFFSFALQLFGGKTKSKTDWLLEYLKYLCVYLY
jgi:hypothetical protein